MVKSIFQLTKPADFRRAGPGDLMEMAPRGGNLLILPKGIIEELAHGVTDAEVIHISGPSGGAKTALIESLLEVPENFNAVCRERGKPVKPVRLHTIPMVTYESPGELWCRVELRGGDTCVVPSSAIQALLEAEADHAHYHVVWFREVGRTFSASVQSGLLDLIGNSVTLPPAIGARTIDSSRVAYLFDSNYLASDNHVLTKFDDALRRRPTLHITMDYLDAEQELAVLLRLVDYYGLRCERATVRKLVKLAQLIRAERREGQLQSAPPVSIHNMLAFLRHHDRFPARSLNEIASATVLPSTVEDRGHANSVSARAFGLSEEPKEDMAGVPF